MARRGVLDQRDDAVGHELGGSYWCSSASGFGDGDHASSGGDLDPPAGPSGGHLVRADVIACFDDDLDAVTLHMWVNAPVQTNTPGSPIGCLELLRRSASDTPPFSALEDQRGVAAG